MHRHGNALLLGTLLALQVLSAAGASAQAGEEPVALDKLLKIPSGAAVGRVEAEKRGGRTRRQWQERYRIAHQEIEEAEESLSDTREALEERRSEESGQWKMAAPGIGDATSTSDAPTDYRISQQLRRDREEVARSDRALQDLDVEANLAGVPEDWRKEDESVAR